MVYGGTIRPGSCEGAPQLDIVSAFQSYGKYLQDGQTLDAERERYNTVRHACPGPGACGGVCCVYFYKLYKLTQRKDVYCEYNGECRRGPWDDTTGFIFIPRRKPREVGRVRLSWDNPIQSLGKEHLSQRYHDPFCLRKCHGTNPLFF